MNRRTWLTAIIALAGSSVLAIVAVPALLFSLSPAFETRRRAAWRAIGQLSEFEPGSMKRVLVDRSTGEWDDALDSEAVYVWRAGVAEVVVFSRACTDLGCPVTWDPGSEWFFCPCHGGIFARDGTPRAGPPPRPLHRYPARINDGVVEINLDALPPEA